jgi:hypothetical protein
VLPRVAAPDRPTGPGALWRAYWGYFGPVCVLVNRVPLFARAGRGGRRARHPRRRVAFASTVLDSLRLAAQAVRSLRETLSADRADLDLLRHAFEQGQRLL